MGFTLRSLCVHSGVPQSGKCGGRGAYSPPTTLTFDPSRPIPRMSLVVESTDGPGIPFLDMIPVVGWLLDLIDTVSMIGGVRNPAALRERREAAELWA